MAACWAIAPPKVDNLQMQAIPRACWEDAFKVALNFGDVVGARQLPAAGEPVDVGINGERRFAEGLRHHHAGGFVANAR